MTRFAFSLFRRLQERHRSIDRYSSMDSSDTFLSCNTHPFPSQGSLAGLEELAARGTMAANGSMPAVNIAGVCSGVYVNPFEPPQSQPQSRRWPHGGGGGGGNNGGRQHMHMMNLPSDSPHRRHLRRVGSGMMGKRTASSDTEDTFADALDHEEDVYRELTETQPNKFRRARALQMVMWEDVCVARISFSFSHLCSHRRHPPAGLS